MREHRAARDKVSTYFAPAGPQEGEAWPTPHDDLITAGPALRGRLGRLAAYPWRAQALGNRRVTSRDTEHSRVE